MVHSMDTYLLRNALLRKAIIGEFTLVHESIEGLKYKNQELQEIFKFA